MNGFGDETFDFAQGSVYGFRNWHLWNFTKTLYGATNQPWFEPSMTAICKIDTAYPHDPLDVPKPECTCGIYAYWSKSFWSNYSSVGGVIEGSGKTIIGDKGFRTQHAQVKALCFGPWDHSMFQNPNDVIESIANSFGVPLYDSFEDMVEDFPLTTDYLPADPNPRSQDSSDLTI